MKNHRLTNTILRTITLLATLSLASVTLAQTPPGSEEAQAIAPPEAPLRIATKPFAPFVFEGEGNLSGFSIVLWEEIANELERPFDWVRTDSVSALLGTLQEDTADVAIAGITITSEREDVLDFSHPFFQSGLQVMVPANGSGGASSVTSVLSTIFSFSFLKIVAGLVFLLFAAANILWLCERKQNPEMFPHSYGEGVWNAFWWSAVTVTTVGYGDKVPRTPAGRLVAVIWMFAGLIFLGFFTASIASTLTIESLEGSISGPDDLPGHRVATVQGTTATTYLYDHGVRVAEFESIDDCYLALSNEEVDAIVYDSPALRYYATHAGAGQTRVVGPLFQEQAYGIAVPIGSPLREDINQALLTIRENGTYQRIYGEYFGD